MKKICDRCEKEPVAMYKLIETTGTLDCAILDELWLCEGCLTRAIRNEKE